MRLWQLMMASLLACSGASAASNSRDSEVLQEVDGTSLSGTLLLAPGEQPSTLMILVSGSGPTDRNGNPFGAKNGSNAYSQLATALADRGISSLRFDKRFLPTATPPTKETELRFSTLADDVAAWVNRFAADARFKRVIVVGHSEGATLGALAVQRSKAAGYVSIAGAGVRASDILRWQLRSKLPPGLVAENERILRELENGKAVNDVPAPLLALYRPQVQPYLMSWIAVDPALEIGKVQVPTAIVQGDTDIQVRVLDAKLLEKSKSGATSCVIAGMNHVLKHAAANDLTAYTDPSLPVDATLVNFLEAFAAHVEHPAKQSLKVEGCQDAQHEGGDKAR